MRGKGKVRVSIRFWGQASEALSERKGLIRIGYGSRNKSLRFMATAGEAARIQRILASKLSVEVFC